MTTPVKRKVILWCVAVQRSAFVVHSIHFIRQRQRQCQSVVSSTWAFVIAHRGFVFVVRRRFPPEHCVFAKCKISVKHKPHQRTQKKRKNPIQSCIISFIRTKSLRPFHLKLGGVPCLSLGGGELPWNCISIRTNYYTIPGLGILCVKIVRHYWKRTRQKKKTDCCEEDTCV